MGLTLYLIETDIIFSEPLCSIFNLIMRTCTFPDFWKISRISPLYKKGPKNEITNHRRIAVLCSFSKVFEILIHTFMSSHLKNIIVPKQHGFIEGYSTITNLICKTQFINEVLDERGQVVVIQLSILTCPKHLTDLIMDYY